MAADIINLKTINEAVRRQFELARREGNQSPISDFLPATTSPSYLATLEDLVLIELEITWKAWAANSGVNEPTPAIRPPVTEDFLASFPELNQPEIVARILRHENEVRRQSGDQATFRDLQNRFPEIAETLNWSESKSPPRGAPEHLPEIPGYEILDVIGRGGMGLVLRARHKLLGRVVAIKVPLAHRQMDEQDRQRFLREAQTAAGLRHAHICPLFEVGEHTGHPYIAMAFIQGETLDSWGKRTVASAHRSAEILAKVARAVAYAHTQGIVHRDIKPSNVMIDAETGEPMLMDFGLAKQLGVQESNLTQTGQVVGTPAYMSPEQARGRVREIGTPSDIYSLGAILYHQLCGRPPFQGSLTDVLEMVAKHEPIAPTKIAPKTHRDLETICLKAMSKEPAFRYASADALASDLERFCAGEAILARREPWVYRLGRNVRRHPVAAGLAVAVVIVSSIGAYIGYASFNESRLRTEISSLAESIRTDLEQVELTEAYLGKIESKLASLQRVSPERAAEEHRRLLKKFAEQIQSSIRLRLTESDDGQIEAAITLLAARDDRWTFALRQELDNRRRRLWKSLFAWRSPLDKVPIQLSGTGVRLQANGLVHPLLAARQSSLRPPVVPLTATSAGSVQLEAEFSSGWERSNELGLLLNSKVGNTGPIESISFSPQMERIATTAKETIVWDLATGRELFSFHRKKSASMTAAFHPKTGQLAVGCSGEATVWLLQPLIGTVERELAAHDGGVFCLAFGFDGKSLVTGGRTADQKGEVKLWNTADWSLSNTFTSHDKHAVRRVAISPDARWLASSGDDGSVHVTDVSSKKISYTTRTQRFDYPPDIVFSADSRHLAHAACVDHNIPSGFNAFAGVLNLESGEMRPIPGGGLAAGVSSLAFSPDGKDLAIASAWANQVSLYNLTTTQLRIFAPHVASQPVKIVAQYSPDGSQMALGTADSIVRLMDVASGHTRQSFENGGYEFSLRSGAGMTSSGGDGSMSQESLDSVRKRGGEFRLVVVRNGIALRERTIRAAQVHAGPLRISASREGSKLTLRVNELDPLEFDDLFPQAAGESGQFAIRWPDGISLSALAASQQALPARPTALESGDDHFARGQLAAALRNYQEQVIATPGTEAEQEALVKSALCQLAMHNDADALKLLEQVAAGIGPRWPPIAGCQLWMINLQAGRLDEADDVFESLSKRYKLADLVALIPQGFRERILNGYQDAVHYRNLWVHPDPRRLRKLERAAAIHEYFQTPLTNRRELMVALVRAHHLEGHLERGAALAQEVLTLESYWEGADPIQRAALASEQSWLLRQLNQPEKALEVVRQWRFDRSGKHRDRSSQLQLELARVLMAQGKLSEAEKELDDYIKTYRPQESSYPLFGAACLARGILRDERGDRAGALASWREGQLERWSANESGKANRSLAAASGDELLYALPLATYSGNLTDEDARRVSESLLSRLSDSKLLATASGVVQLPPMQAREMWQSPRGRICARRLAWLDLSAAEFYRLAFVLAAYDTVLQSNFDAQVSPDQDTVLWKLLDDGYVRFADGKIGIPQLLGIGLTWKGTTGALGWDGVKHSLEPSLRGPMAYVFGHRYVRLKQREKAIAFFQGTLADSPPDSPHYKLARKELDALLSAEHE